MTEIEPKLLEQMNGPPSYKGGCTCLYGGYVWEFCPGHHLQNKWGWVAQHRLVAEDKIGRRLVRSRDAKKGEHVHHIDGTRTNNDPANLEVLTKSEHHRYESRKYAATLNQHLTLENVATALIGRTIREAAESLGVHHMTLRNRCPEGIAHRKRRTPSSPKSPENLAKLRAMAADTSIGIHEAAKLLRMGERTILKACAIHKIDWVRKSKVGMLHRTYRGKPTQRAIELRASGIDPESTRRHPLRPAKQA